MFCVPDEYKKFVASVKRKCKYHGIQLILSPSKQVVDEADFKNEVSGYFDGDNKLFVVACGKPVEDWIDVFVHESCHLDQWIKDNRYEDWTNATVAFWDYMLGNKMLNKVQFSKIVDKMIELELDCEKRSVEVIKKWKLPINIEKYIQDSNTYIYSYRIMGEYKRFPTALCKDRQLVKAAPKTFQKSYKNVPKALERELHRFYGEMLAKAA